MFDSTFYESLENHGFQGLNRSYKKDYLLSKRGIIIPCFEGPRDYGHWYLVFFDVSFNTLSLYEPLKKHKYQERMDTLKHLLDDYLRPLYETHSEQLPPVTLNLVLPPNIPQQNDGFNCGVFLLAFGKALICQKEFSFCNADMQQFRKTIWQELKDEAVTRKIKEEYEIFQNDVEDFTEDEEIKHQNGVQDSIDQQETKHENRVEDFIDQEKIKHETVIVTSGVNGLLSDGDVDMGGYYQGDNVPFEIDQNKTLGDIGHLVEEYFKGQEMSNVKAPTQAEVQDHMHVHDEDSLMMRKP